VKNSVSLPIDLADVGQTLFAPHQHARLLENGKRSADRKTAGLRKVDYYPVAKLIDPISNSIWLVTEINPTKPNMAIGLIDLGTGAPEIGRIDLLKLVSLRQGADLSIRTDTAFKAAGRLSSYAHTAQAIGRITA